MKILFVCTANICRSALAEVIMRKKLQEKGLTDIVVDSSGVHDYAGEPRDDMICSYARKAGYDMGGVSTYIGQYQTESFDLIVCMEFFHVVEMQKLLPYDRWGSIRLFNEICFGEQTDLMDPSGDTEYIYDVTIQHIEAGCEKLVEKLSKNTTRL